VIWKHIGRAELHKFLIFLDNQHPNIHFTINIEKYGKLSFLDVLVSKKTDGTLSHQVYRKPTHRYLHAEYHHLAQKQSTIDSLVYRAFIISDKEQLQTKLNYLKLALPKNTTKKDIIKTINKQRYIFDTSSDEMIHFLICQRNNRSDW